MTGTSLEREFVLLSRRDEVASRRRLIEHNREMAPACPHCGKPLLGDEVEYLGLHASVGDMETTITHEGRPVYFTKTESTILAFLMRLKGRVATKAMLYEAIYWHDNGDEAPDPKIIDIFVHKIRRRIQAFDLPVVIDTVWGRGYRLISPEQHAREQEALAS